MTRYIVAVLFGFIMIACNGAQPRANADAGLVALESRDLGAGRFAIRLVNKTSSQVLIGLAPTVTVSGRLVNGDMIGGILMKHVSDTSPRMFISLSPSSGSIGSDVEWTVLAPQDVELPVQDVEVRCTVTVVVVGELGRRMESVSANVQTGR
jgi:hypothetical protein